MAVVHSTTAKAGQGETPVQPKSKNSRVKDRRTEALRIRVTPTEHGAMTATAEGMGLGTCSWARMLLVAAVGHVPTPAPPRRREPKPASRELAKAIGEIARIGNNLNQLARHANSGFDVDPYLIGEARDELRKLREFLISAGDAGAGP